MTDVLPLQGQVGDSLAQKAVVYDVVDGVATLRDLSGVTLAAAVRYGPTSEADLAPAPNLVAAVTDAEHGTLELSLPVNHALDAGDFYYEIDQIKGANRTTLLSGPLAIKPSLFA